MNSADEDLQCARSTLQVLVWQLTKHGLFGQLELGINSCQR